MHSQVVSISHPPRISFFTATWAGWWPENIYVQQSSYTTYFRFLPSCIHPSGPRVRFIYNLLDVTVIYSSFFSHWISIVIQFYLFSLWVETAFFHKIQFHLFLSLWCMQSSFKRPQGVEGSKRVRLWESIPSRRLGRSFFAEGNEMTPSIAAALHYLSLYLFIDRLDASWVVARHFSPLLVVADINDIPHIKTNIFLEREPNDPTINILKGVSI